MQVLVNEKHFFLAVKLLCAVQGQGPIFASKEQSTNGCTNQKPKDYMLE